MRASKLLAALSLLGFAVQGISGCAPKPTAEPTVAPSATMQVTDTALPVPTVAPQTPESTLPALTLKPGDFYFSFEGTPALFFSRNVGGYQQGHYDTFFDWMNMGGSKVARIQLDSLGMGYTDKGEINPNWLAQWDRVFDDAEAHGIYVLPAFSTWFDWNAGQGYSTWKSNPLNAVNGGPVKQPGELFEKDSATQKLWLQWMRKLVEHWQGRKNILAWEIFSEVNLASGTTEAKGIQFVNDAAAIIRTTDMAHRPVTASIADTGTWPNFYRDTNIDFINIHPYPPSAQLDRTIISAVRNELAAYNRPVLIGESGLSASTPDSAEGKITVAENARRGTEHAIWAGVVSGAMNGRALYWEDSFGIYFPELGMQWMEPFQKEELPAVKFTTGVDFTGFKPLAGSSSAGIWGAALGNEKAIIAWYRDAGSEPPNWPVKPVLSGQTVTMSIPGNGSNWQVDFYNARTGTDIVGSATITATAGKLIIALPDFSDDIAFKAHVLP